MKQKIGLTLTLLLWGIIIIGQPTSRDSLKKQLDSLEMELKRLSELSAGCTEFEIHNTPTWADKTLNSKTYYRDCKWSGTYIILNSDSTFLYKHNGEGGDNYVQMGNWEIRNDTMVVLIGIDKLTNKFLLKIKQFEDKQYKSISPFVRRYIRKQNLLLKHEYLETESN